jgi:hypothetical protein
MNATPYLHLLWKEYRAIRAFWLSLVLLVMGAFWLTMALSTDATDSMKLLYSLALGAPAFFALGAAGTSFALEQEEGTFDFLRAAPVSARQVLTSKLGLTLLSTVAMLLVLVPIAWRISGGQLPEPQVLRGMLGLWLLAAIEAIAWGAFFSLLTARPLSAICLALVVVSVTVHVMAWNAGAKASDAFNLTPYLTAAPWRAAVAVTILAADVLLGLRWLSDAEPVARPSWTRWKNRRMRGRSTTRTGTNGDTATIRLSDEPSRRTMLGHLLWQHWRQSGRLMLLMGFLQFALVMVAVLGGSHDERVAAIIPLAPMAALAGAFVFLPDQEKRNYRFFVEHNIPPRTVWLSRQLPWIGLFATSTFLLCLLCLHTTDSIPRNWANLPRMAWDGVQFSPTLPFPWSLSRFQPFVLLGVVLVAISYASGQWTSMFVRSGLLAGFFGLLLAGLLCTLALLLGVLGLSWTAFVLPIPFVLLAATWLRAPDWVAENIQWSARLRAGAIVLVPAVALFMAAINSRVNQLPDVALNFNPAEYQAKITDESRETAEMYRRADELLVSRRYETSDSVWAMMNHESLALLLDASARESCTLDDPAKSSDDRELNHEAELLRLVLVSARELELKGDLDAAVDRYFAAIRMISHWQQHTAAGPDMRWPSAFLMKLVFRDLRRWSAQAGQTPERIRGAIDRLSAMDGSILHVEDGLKSNYIRAQRALEGDSADIAALVGQPPYLTLLLLRLRLPWERERELRGERLSTVNILEYLKEFRAKLSGGEEIKNDVPPYDSGRLNGYPLLTDFWLVNEVLGIHAMVELAEFEESKRATLVVLALAAYRLEHGQLPATLSDLVSQYLPKLPLDPYSGREFYYFPEGVPKPASEADAADLVEALARWPEMAARKPGIWSPGRVLQAIPWRGTGGWQSPEVQAIDNSQVIYYGTREQDRLSLYQALSRGQWFAIPTPEPMTPEPMK